MGLAAVGRSRGAIDRSVSEVGVDLGCSAARLGLREVDLGWSTALVDPMEEDPERAEVVAPQYWSCPIVRLGLSLP